MDFKKCVHYFNVLQVVSSLLLVVVMADSLASRNITSKLGQTEGFESVDNFRLHDVKSSPNIVKTSFNFTRPHYFVSVPEYTRKASTTMIIPGANREFLLPGPDPGGGEDEEERRRRIKEERRRKLKKMFSKLSGNDSSDTQDSKSASISVRNGQSSHLYVSPYEKMGIYISDKNLRVKYKVVEPTMRKLFSAKEKHVGDFYFLILKTRDQDLNREERSQYNITIHASIHLARSSKTISETRCNVTVFVEDVNDLSPYFIPNYYETTVREDIPVDSKLVNVTAFDPDIGLKSEAYYTLANSEPEIFKMFAVHPTLGIITNTRPLTRPSKSHLTSSTSSAPPASSSPYKYTLTILARDRISYLDHRGKSLSAHNATVVINVIPVNRFPPRMTIKQHSTLVAKSFPTSSALTSPFIRSRPPTTSRMSRSQLDSPLVYAVVQVTDDDGDDTVFGQICSLSIVDGNHLGLFYVTNSTSNEYRIELRQQKNSPPSKASNSQASNNHSHNHFHNNGNDYDNDAHDEASSVLLNSEKFLQTIKGYGLEFNMTLEASDCGGLSTNSTIKAFINPFTDSRDSPIILPSFTKESIVSVLQPRFEHEHYYAEIHEVLLPGSMVTQMKVKLPFEMDKSSSFGEESFNSPSPTIVYSIDERSVGAKNFGISPNGIVYTRMTLDYEKANKFYTLRIKARLSTVSSAFSDATEAKAILHVKILDDNDNGPVFKNRGIKFSSSGPIIEVSVDENKPSDLLVLKLEAEDLDSGDNGTIIYSFVSADPVPFKIDGDTGDIKTTEKLDFEKGPKFYTLTVRASDLGTPYRRQSELIINITVRDMNDHRPMFKEKFCTSHVPITTRPYSSITTLHAIDLDAKSRITYHLFLNMAANDSLSDCFRVNEFTGNLKLVCDLQHIIANQKLPFETWLNVTASDGDHISEVLPIKVIINNFENVINYLPTFECSSTPAIYRNPKSPSFELPSGVRRFHRRDLDFNNRINDILTDDGKFGDYDEGLEINKLGAFSKVDYNQHAPEFDFGAVKEIYVRENLRIGSRIIRFSAKDSDKGYEGLLVWSLNLHTYQNSQKFAYGVPFNIVWNTGDLIVVDVIDREVQSSYQLNVTVCDLGYKPSQKCSSTSKTILIDDENDNPPRFDLPVYYFSVSENARIGTEITEFHAIDEDLGTNRIIRYSLTNHDNRFAIDEESGVLTIRGVLDRESISKYELFVSATDSGIPRLSSTARVIIQVEDVNDNAPIFHDTAHSIRIREDYPVGSLLTKVSAYDPDEGKGGRIKYFIEPSSDDDGAAKKFSLDELTGNIRLAGDLDFETRQEYKISIVARDEGIPSLSSSITLIVDVEDVDENRYPPKFRDGVVAVGKVLENSPVGTFVMKITATDDDCPHCRKPVVYQIVYGDGLGRFTIDEDGRIFTKSVLDRETSWRYWLTVVAKDKAPVPKIGHIHVLIFVNDVNDNAPVTSEPFYYANIPENVTIGTSILQLHAVDKDVNDVDDDEEYDKSKEDEVSSRFTFRILNPSDGCPFAMDPNKGTLTVASELDHEDVAHYILDVEIGESNTLKTLEPSQNNQKSRLISRTPIIITVGNINDNPPRSLISRFRCYTYDNLENFTPICHIIVYDEDDLFANSESIGGHSSSLTFQLVADANENHLFRIDETTGAIYFNSSGPIASRDYSLLVSCTDNGDPKQSSQISVSIKVLPSSASLPTTTIATTLFPSNDTLLEEDKIVEEKRITNSKPIFKNDPSQDGTLTVSEDVKVGHFLMLVDAFDPDDDKVCAHIVRASEDGVFALLDNALVTARPLDYETTSSYNLTIMITDGVDSSYFDVSVNVNDVNDNFPHFYQSIYTVNVYENISKDSEILVLPVYDLDVNDKHVYSLYSTGSPESYVKFEVEYWSGVIRVKGALDHELARQHELIVEVADSRLNGNDRSTQRGCSLLTDSNPYRGFRSFFSACSHRSFAKVVINVLDVNDHKPECVSSFLEANVVQTAAVGTSVLQIIASDADAEENALLWYSIVAGDEKSFFDIDRELGFIYVARSLTESKLMEYFLRVKITDSGNPPLSSTANVRVTITLPDNQNPLYGEKQHFFELSEDTKIGTIIGSVRASSRQPLFYELLSSSSETPNTEKEDDGRHHFAINANNGEIYLRNRLDYEVRKKYELTVMAMNLVRAFDTAKVIINVLDVNDNSPTWVRREYRGKISESAHITSLVTTLDGQPLIVEATDIDFNQNGLIRYQINERYAKEFFDVDSSTGAITLRNQVDYERWKEISFTVSAFDQGFPISLKADSDAHVTVMIENVNDCPPNFDRPNYHAIVFLPTFANIKVIRLNASDCDSESHHNHRLRRIKSAVNPPTILKYSLLNTSDASKKFAINQTSGLITVSDPSTLAEESYQLHAIVSDGKHSSQTTILIEGKQIPKSTLRFERSTFTGHVTENSTDIKTIMHLAVVGARLKEHIFFSILSADQYAKMFRIIPTSGSLRTVGLPFDRESVSEYRLIVEVRSVFHPRRVDQCEVRLVVDDVNDNAPLFINKPYHFVANSRQSIDEPIGKVQAIDHDVGPNGFVSYTILSGDVRKLFMINSESGHIFMFRPVDSLDAAFHELVVEARDAGSNPLRSTANVTIKVISGGMPVFAQPYYSINVPENQSPSIPFITISASSPQDRQLIYSLVSGNDMEEFTIDFNTGLVSVLEKLDREITSEYDLQIAAMDSISGINSTVKLHIVVDDVNDNPPMFNQSSFTAAILESALPGSSVTQVHATDRDSPLSKNSQIEYSLASNSSIFHISSDTGVIYLRSQIDHEIQEQHHLVVVASDLGSPMLKSTCQVWINVIDVNDNAPYFVQPVYSAIIDENSQRDMFVLKLTAVDLDSSDAGKIRYRIIAGNIDNIFYLEASSGILRTHSFHRKMRALKAAAAASTLPPIDEFLLNISVTDGVYSNYAQAKIKIAYANNHSPRFEQTLYDVVLNESVPIGTPVITLRASDTDYGAYGTVSYSIVSSVVLNWFKIDAKTGLITTTDKIDREKHHIFTLTALAKDKGNRIGLTVVRITITDSNDNSPQFLVKEYEALVCSDTSTGTNIIPVVAIDKDATPTFNRIWYNIYESNKGLTRDLASPSVHGTSTNPVKSYPSKVFTVGSETGFVSVTGNLSSLIGEVFQFFVKASDYGGLSSVVPVTIRIIDACQMSGRDLAAHYEVSVLEDTKIGSIFTGVNISGIEALELSLVGSSEDASSNMNSNLTRFRVDKQGKIYLLSTLDRESSLRHIIILKVRHLKSFAVWYLNVKINVVDSNDNVPQFDSRSYFLELSEDQEVGSSIMRIQANDLDEDVQSPIRYRIKKEVKRETVSSEASNYFDLDSETGWLRLTRQLDRESDEWHNLTIWITDGVHSNTTSLTIRTMDSNDNPPYFEHSLYNVALYEDRPVNSLVLTVEAHDKDSNEQSTPLNYFIVEGDPLNQFRISEVGEIYLDAALDREKVDKYDLQLLATDSKYVATTRVMIELLDANDNGPVCKKSKYVELVSEAVKIGSEILTVEATDADEHPNDQLYFTISYDDHDSEAQPEEMPFMIDPQEGILRTKTQLNREKKSSYYLVTKVHDDKDRRKFCTSSIEILVSDVNDNPPQFTNKDFVVSVPEDSKVGIVIGKINAIDQDLGRNRQVRYQLINSGDDSFIIDSYTGIIRLNKPLDRETIESFTLTAKAYDTGEPSLFSLMNFIVKVQDVNDNAPEFVQTLYQVSIKENHTIGSEVVTVLATSKDTGVNAEITYSITAGNKDSVFIINPKSGVLSLANSLDYEAIKEYFLTVKAEDGGTPPLFSESKVNVSIMDVNDNPPRFSQKSYSIVIPEDTVIGEKVHQMVAVDADTGRNGQLSYYFSVGQTPSSVNGTASNLRLQYKNFKIEPQSGIITVVKPLDREMISSYVMEVICVDGGDPQLSSLVLVIFEISDVNDNPPTFNQSNYSIFVQESKKIGESILKFTITDADSYSHSGPFKLSIEEGNAGHVLSLDIENHLLKVHKPLNHSATSRYKLKVKATDSGKPPLSSYAWVTVNIIEESRFQPILATPISVTVNSFSDQFPGGLLTRLSATDRDIHDRLTYALVSASDREIFSLDSEDGTLIAHGGVDIGRYSLNVSVHDGKYTVYGMVHVEIIQITEEMLTNSVQLVLSPVTDQEFMNRHKKQFDKSLRNILNVPLKDIFLISVQSSSSSKKLSSASSKQRRSPPIEETSTLEVLFAIHKTLISKVGQSLFSSPSLPSPSPSSIDGSWTSEFYPASFVRKKLLENKASIESQIGLKIVRIDEDGCERMARKTARSEEHDDKTSEASTLFCKHGQCRDDIVLDESRLAVIPMNTSSFVCPYHEKKIYCDCHPGFGGDACEDVANQCRGSVSPCPSFKQCTPAATELGYVCLCPFGKTGPTCNQNNIKYCQDQKDVSLCYMEINPITFHGTSYAQYELAKSTMERLSLRLKSLQTRATIMYALGNRDYSILEIAGGHIQYRYDCGSGEGLIRVEDIFINDGKWHEVTIDQKVNSASITLDSKYRAGGQAPGLNDILNLENGKVYFGSEVRPRPSAIGGEEIKDAFIGCLDNIRLDDNPLPMQVTSSSSYIAHLKRLTNVKFGNCGLLPKNRPNKCECLNGGTCIGHSNGSYSCFCPPNKYRGDRCEIDLRRPCSPNPCENGGTCIISQSTSSSFFGYECECPPTFGGMHCESSKICSDSNPCQNGGKCEGSLCKCKPGFRGLHCEEDIDECTLPNISCSPPATCINLPGSYRCICPIGGSSGPSQCVNYNLVRSSDRTFLWDDFLLPGIFAIIILFSILVIIFCCYFTRSRPKSRHNRTPNNIYRSGLDGNEFLLKNHCSFTDNNVNMQRFSKLTALESSSLLGHGQFSSSEPLPNHHFHQALANNGDNQRPNSFGSGALNNFDDDIVNFGASNGESTGSMMINDQSPASKSNGKKKISSTPKNSPTCSSPQYVDNHNHNETSQLPESKEGKIQNINGESGSSSVCKSPTMRASLSGSELNGYHWDCYDLEEVNRKSIGNNLGQVSVNEIRDAESNSDNSQIELLSSEDLGGEGESCKRVISSVSKHQPHHLLHNHRHQSSSVLSSSSNNNNPFELPSSLAYESGKFSSSSPSPSSSASNHIQPRLQPKKTCNISDVNNSAKYVAHPDQYLPVYKTSADKINENGDNSAKTTINAENGPENECPTDDTRDLVQRRRKIDDLRRKRERRLTSAFETSRQDAEVDETNSIKTDNRRQSTFV